MKEQNIELEDKDLNSNGNTEAFEEAIKRLEEAEKNLEEAKANYNKQLEINTKILEEILQ